jgi:hypothetical protein
MKQIKLADLDVVILEDNERKDLAEKLQEEYHENLDKLKDVMIETAKGPVSGKQFYEMCQHFEEQAKDFPIDRIMPNIETYVKAGDEMFDKIQHYDFPYVNAKNIMAGTEILEGYVILNNKESDIKDYIIEKHFAAKIYLAKASLLLEESMRDKKDSSLKAIETQINGLEGSLCRRRAFFSIQSENDLSNLFEERYLFDILFISGQAHKAYEDLFKNGVFLDEKEAAINLANYANVHKLSFSPAGYAKGIKYYEEARKYVGENQNILFGIEFLKNAIKSNLKRDGMLRKMHDSIN